MECLRTAVVAFCLVQCMSFRTRPIKDEIQVDGDDFVSFELWERRELYTQKEHTLRFEFKTMKQNGMLVYIGSQYEMGDFLMVDLVRGKLRYGVYLILKAFIVAILDEKSWLKCPLLQIVPRQKIYLHTYSYRKMLPFSRTYVYTNKTRLWENKQTQTLSWYGCSKQSSRIVLHKACNFNLEISSYTRETISHSLLSVGSYKTWRISVKFWYALARSYLQYDTKYFSSYFTYSTGTIYHKSILQSTPKSLVGDGMTFGHHAYLLLVSTNFVFTRNIALWLLCFYGFRDINLSLTCVWKHLFKFQLAVTNWLKEANNI